MAVGKQHNIYQVTRGVPVGNNGQTKSEDLVAENWIAYHSFEHSNSISEREITGITLETMPTVNVDFADRRVKCSTNQIFYVEGGTWACHDPSITNSTSTQLVVGNKVLTNEGTYIEVTAIATCDDHELVHIDFGGGTYDVNDNNNYFASGVCLGRFNRDAN